MLREPLGVYVNWSAYDELSDSVPLTQELAMTQFEHLLRLRRAGARLDCYLMDCFWYEPASAYRSFRRAHWRDDGEGWLAACREHGVLPGLWFGCNSAGGFGGLAVADAWRTSVDPEANPRWANACLFEGGFLADFMAAFDHWYRRGVRVFKLDFLNLAARLPHHQLSLLDSEVRAMNAEAFRTALRTFRREHPEAVVVAYNGFEENGIQSGTDFAPRKTLDHRWLEAVDCFYSGDPRPADVPTVNFWRSKDIYSDHMVRAYRAQGFAPRVIDNAGFMIGTTGTCYGRGKEAWKGMLLLSLARGGWLNTYYGNLDLLDAEDAIWFARAQALLWPLLRADRSSTIGALPGSGQPYGFLLEDEHGAIAAVVNPGQLAAELALPARDEGRVLFADAGFSPRLTGGRVALGAEQLALIGFGAYADARHDLGRQEDVRIPEATRALAVDARADRHNAVIASLTCAPDTRVRVIVRQTDNGRAKRTTGGAPPKGRRLGELLRLSATLGGQPVPIAIAYDKAIWSGLSWMAGEIAIGAAGGDLQVRAESSEHLPVSLAVEAYVEESAEKTGRISSPVAALST
jgi:hypothetical protein